MNTLKFEIGNVVCVHGLKNSPQMKVVAVMVDTVVVFWFTADGNILQHQFGACFLDFAKHD